ncbi:MAG: response regulator [Verrucomicrobiae bacterium]|nr:response regulator [Verrucomicrobiae bacterium]MCP5540410.1 response regulator [Akkermansiaceae bacterium]
MSAESPDSKPRLLVVEDDRIVGMDLRATLEARGYEVAGVARSAAEALSLGAAVKPDLALVDIRLAGEGDGIEAARALTADGGVPILFLTGYSGAAVLERVRDLGPVGFLRKPFSEGELIASLESALGNAATRRALASRATQIEPPRADPSARASALERASQLARRPSFRELLGPRGRGENGGGTPAAPEDEAGSLFESLESETPPAAAPGGGTFHGGLIDEIADPLLGIDENWVVTHANAEAFAYFGGKTPLLGRDFWSCFDDEVKAAHFVSFTRPFPARKRRQTVELRDERRGTWLEVSLYAAGEGLVGIFRDVTDRKRFEMESTRVQRLEGLGLLARGFAHDFNNLLTVLIGNLELVRERCPDDPEVQEEVGNASRAAEDGRNLVQQLMTFARGGQPVREKVRVAELLRHILRQRRHRHPAIRYQFQCNRPDLTAVLDRRQVTRLIENLVANAEQAMPRGGALIARCSAARGDDAGRLKDAPIPADEDYLIIEIIDTGRGMTPEELAHAFDPYFTTRDGANATGIGLTVCESIAKAHGGFVVLQSKTGRGTIATFCSPLEAQGWDEGRTDDASQTGVSLPPRRPAREDGAPPPGDSAPAPDAAPARILVLEDDALIRRLIAVTLRRDDHEVVETADGRDTVRVYREAMETGERFDLVLCDLTIVHGMGGVETMRALRRLDPEVRSIVSSGYSDAPAMARPADFGFDAVLPKPYPPKDLRRMIGEMLGDRRGVGKNA